MRYLNKLRKITHSKCEVLKKAAVSGFTNYYSYIWFHDCTFFFEKEVVSLISNLVHSKKIDFSIKDVVDLLDYYKDIKNIQKSYDNNSITSKEFTAKIKVLFSSRISFIEQKIFNRAKHRFQNLDEVIRIMTVVSYRYTDEQKYFAYYHEKEKQRVQNKRDFLALFK